MSKLAVALAHRFLASLETVERLDLLLYLRELKGRSVTARTLAATGLFSVQAAEVHLAKLCARGYLGVEIGTELHYAYRPVDPAIRYAVDELEREMSKGRAEIVALFESSVRGALIVEDDADMREILRVFLENRGFRATALPHGRPALLVAETETLALAVVAVRSSLTNGLAILRTLRERSRSVATIVMTSFSDARVLHSRIAELNVTHVLEKPFQLDDFGRIVQLCTTQSHVEGRNR